jgi:hypothetical protein
MQHGPAASSGSNPKAPGSAGGYLLCDCLEEAVFAEARPIVFGIAWHQIDGPQVVKDASQTPVRRREVTRENVHPCGIVQRPSGLSPTADQ